MYFGQKGRLAGIFLVRLCPNIKIMKVSTLNNKDLLRLVSSDTRGSFERFYHLYYAQVFRFAYYFLRDAEACREVVTDVFFAVWQSRRRLKEIANIETYLYIVVRNEVNRYRNKASDTLFLPLEELSSSGGEKSQADSPEETLLTKEIETLLARAIDELPEKCRQIFLMSREEGLKPKEIAEILTLNESTVRVQMKIAIEKITARLKPVFPDLRFSLLLLFI